VDREGRPVIDPTKNVLNLVEASVRRLDDLRRQSEKYIVDMATMDAAPAQEPATSTQAAPAPAPSPQPAAPAPSPQPAQAPVVSGGS